jgi:spore maturation protein CgeB
LHEEAEIYASAQVLINVHEDYQREFGGDCNERTFKIPFCGGFEITDKVGCLERYFEIGKELVVADSPADWREKIDFYISNPVERQAIIEAGRRRVLAEHTYHHRAKKILELHSDFKRA